MSKKTVSRTIAKLHGTCANVCANFLQKTVDKAGYTDYNIVKLHVWILKTANTKEVLLQKKGEEKPMTGKTVTRDDVARKANVSSSIVSYVINNTRNVSPEKRQRVLDAIKELNYIPNAAARGLKVQKTFHIAYICDDVTNIHFAEMLQELERISYKSGYFISLCRTRADDAYIDEVLSRRFDGIIISSMRLTVQQINRLSVIPTVILLNRDDSNLDPRLSKLFVNIYDGEFSAIRYLLDIGRRKIAFVECIGNTGVHQSVVDIRKKAYLEALESQPALHGSQPLSISSSDYDSLFRNITEVMKSGDRPDAFVCHDDIHAIVVSGACQRAGFAVPQDVTIIGFDGIRLLKYQSAAISTVEIPRYVMAEKAMKMLLSMIDKKQPSNDYVDTSLMIRY